MRIGFYAPLKSPNDLAPSGDRTIARLMLDAITEQGHSVQIMSDFRALDIVGDPERQEQIRKSADQEYDRIKRLFESQKSPPIDLWFTYHLYHKAPDWLGPRVCDEFNMPYVLAEASHAPKQKQGPWHLGLTQVEHALNQAAGILSLNPRDLACIQPFLSNQAQQLMLPPFIKDVPARAEPKQLHKNALAAKTGFEADVPWLITVAMMRPGDKLRSYTLLAEALKPLREQHWRLIVIGDGDAAQDVRKAFEPLNDRVFFAGALEPDDMCSFVDAADLFVWPAINEAFGMALLEAHRQGLAVVAGRTDGVATVVQSGLTGELVDSGDVASFSQAIAAFLRDPARRKHAGQQAREKFLGEHGFETASKRIHSFLEALI